MQDVESPSSSAVGCASNASGFSYSKVAIDGDRAFDHRSALLVR